MSSHSRVEHSFNEIIHSDSILQKHKWDVNWDHRDPNRKSHSNFEGLDDEVKVPSKSRHIYLIRHGEYHQESQDDLERTLTQKGRKQASFTGKRLKDLDLKFDKVVMSTMTRAKETAEQILK